MVIYHEVKKAIKKELNTQSKENLEFTDGLLKAQIKIDKQNAIKECIDLSDKIELEGETSMEEWKAFKHFRNTLRDKYEIK